MKAQKLGLFLGMNMAVACMVMQGCKAVKPGQGAQSPAYVAPVVKPVSAAPAPAAAVHVVQKGESLSGISKIGRAHV